MTDVLHELHTVARTWQRGLTHPDPITRAEAEATLTMLAELHPIAIEATRPNTDHRTSYETTHRRRLTILGPASLRGCVEYDCPKPAHDWAWLGCADPLWDTAKRRGFCAHPLCYAPLCRSHHFRRDLSGPTCRSGQHPMSGDNIGIKRINGSRFCKACAKDRYLQRREGRDRSAPGALPEQQGNPRNPNSPGDESR